MVDDSKQRDSEQLSSFTVSSFDPLQPPVNLPVPSCAAPSLLALSICGVVVGGVLGAVEGVLFHYVTGGFESVEVGLMWGALLGAGGGLFFALLERAARGPRAGSSIGTTLGLLFGIVSGMAVLYQSIVVHRIIIVSRVFVAIVLAGCVVGFLVGGLLDRCLEWLIRKQPRDPKEPA